MASNDFLGNVNMRLKDVLNHTTCDFFSNWADCQPRKVFLTAALTRPKQTVVYRWCCGSVQNQRARDKMDSRGLVNSQIPREFPLAGKVGSFSGRAIRLLLDKRTVLFVMQEKKNTVVIVVPQNIVSSCSAFVMCEGANHLVCGYESWFFSSQLSTSVASLGVRRGGLCSTSRCVFTEDLSNIS